MPTRSIEQKLNEVARIVAPLAAVEYPGPLALPAPGGDLVALFEQRFNDLRAPGDTEPGVIRVADAHEATATIARLCNGVPQADIIWSGDKPSSPSARVPDGASRLAPRDFAVGITPACALIAGTGSVVLEIADPHDAWPSLLVDRHIVVAGRDQLVPDLPTFYRRLSVRLAQPPRRPIYVCITGCSRTADIEKLLVIPAHGPRQVRVILCATPVDWGLLRRTAPPDVAQPPSAVE